ncbi:MAG: nitroreductase family protein, partial [Ectothiorhodospiraceae bacterium]|nr:nitroreductase family protein [Ectothiorhodospiraceae bacterium]
MKQYIKALLGPNGIRFCLQMVDKIRLTWLRVAYKSAFLSRLHYLLISPSFTREAQAVIAGHIRFEENRKNHESVNYFLRRSIHRLEKGLIMRPRREVFAADYIEDAVASFITGRDNLNQQEADWANAVFTEYFSVTGRNPAIDKARDHFQQFRESSGPDGGSPGMGGNIPYVRALGEPPPVDHDAFRALSVRRRSVRWFQQKPVPRELVDQAIETAALAPSACNRQPFEYRLFDDPALIAPLLELPMGIKGYEDNVPAVAVLVGKLRAYPHP